MSGTLAENVDQLAGLLQRIPARASWRIDDSFAEQGQLQKFAVLERQINDLLVEKSRP